MPQLDLFGETVEEDLITPRLTYEKKLWAAGYQLIAGVDEVGRGPLAGPVVAAACIMPIGYYVEEIQDSKALSPKEREDIYKDLTTNPNVHWAVSIIEHDLIDQLNILKASLHAMTKALETLEPTPDFVLIDGRDSPTLTIPHQAIIKGDDKSQSIAAASILAKVVRDNYMRHMHERYPEYGFDKHKGYATKMHLQALSKHGLSPIHRRSFTQGCVKVVDDQNLW